MRKIAEDFDFIETSDKRGMYKYHDKKRAYIEILSFDKIIDDALAGIKLPAGILENDAE